MTTNTKCLTVLLNGAAGVGKDTFAEMLIAEMMRYGYDAVCHSSVDGVKNAALILGWDGIKDARGRKFLSDLKNLSTAAYEGPMNYMRGLVGKRPVVILMIREPEEIKKFVDEFDSVITILIRRSGITKFDNFADSHVEEYDYSIVIDNDGTLEELEADAEVLAESFASVLKNWGVVATL